MIVWKSLLKIDVLLNTIILLEIKKILVKIAIILFK